MPASGDIVEGGVTCQAAGQLVTTFANTPQLPFTELKAEFFGTARAPVATPAFCGGYTTTATFTPSSATPAVSPTSSFPITSGPNGSPCPGSSLPFSPSLSSGVTNINAGSFSPLTTTLTREDGRQAPKSVVLHYPPGVAGILAGVPLCPEAQANAGTCGEGSLIGETIVSAGLGSDPFTLTGGRVYLTGPYQGAPLGLSIVNPAKAGPFDLQEGRPVVVRAKIEIDPHTAALTVTTGQIPSIVEGFPLQIKHVNVLINRLGFTFNPTSCEPMTVTGTIAAWEGASSPVSTPFRIANCSNLKFGPKFSVSRTARSTRANGQSLTARVSEPAGTFGSQANITKVKGVGAHRFGGGPADLGGVVGEPLEVFEVLWPSRGALHRNQVREAAHADLRVSEAYGDGSPDELAVREVRPYPCHPLQNVQRPSARVKTEVGTLGELHGIGRVVGELLRREIRETDVLGVDLAQQAGEPRQIVVGRLGNDVQVLGCTYETVHAYRDSSDDDKLNARSAQSEEQLIGFEHRPAGPRGARSQTGSAALSPPDAAPESSHGRARRALCLPVPRARSPLPSSSPATSPSNSSSWLDSSPRLRRADRSRESRADHGRRTVGRSQLEHPSQCVENHLAGFLARLALAVDAGHLRDRDDDPVAVRVLLVDDRQLERGAHISSLAQGERRIRGARVFRRHVQSAGLTAPREAPHLTARIACVPNGLPARNARMATSYSASASAASRRAACAQEGHEVSRMGVPRRAALQPEVGTAQACIPTTPKETV